MKCNNCVKWAIEDYLQLNHCNEDYSTKNIGRKRLKQLLQGRDSLDVITEIRNQYKTARYGKKIMVEIRGRDKFLATQLRSIISDFNIGLPGTPRPNLRITMNNKVFNIKPPKMALPYEGDFLSYEGDYTPSPGPLKP